MQPRNILEQWIRNNNNKRAFCRGAPLRLLWVRQQVSMAADRSCLPDKLPDPPSPGKDHVRIASTTEKLCQRDVRVSHATVWAVRTMQSSLCLMHSLQLTWCFSENLILVCQGCLAWPVTCKKGMDRVSRTASMSIDFWAHLNVCSVIWFT